MKKLLLAALLFLATLCAAAQDAPKYTLLLTGASFASPNNGWFEFGCRDLNARPLNRAIGGESIADTAERMYAGTLYSPEELETIDALVIMQVHERDVCHDPDRPLRDHYTDYPFPFDRGNYAGGFDYVT